MQFRALALLVCLAAISSCNFSRSSQQQSRPLEHFNVVLVTIDTLRPDHLHCYGYEKIKTPVLDRIAHTGVLFENAVAQTPLTSPSHASIFTGQYPTVHHVRNTGGFILPSAARPLARILHDQGWHTAAFVSSAVLKKTFGFNNGFDVYDDQMPKVGRREDVREDPERRASDTVDRAVAWLKTQSASPFFMWVHLYDPHLPYDPPRPFKEQYREHPYDGEIAYADHELGRLLDSVAAKSPADKTIIAVLSDHGESLAEHGEYTHGVFLYDSTLRIAFLLSGPGVPSGRRVQQQVRSIDFTPTLLALMGGTAAPDMQGVSLIPTLAGRTVPTEVSYEETLYPKLSLGWAELRGIRTNHWKYIRAPKSELYDLTSDPEERNNVIAQHPAEVQKFEAQLNKIGGGASEKIEANLLDERSMEQLRSLGYLSGFSPRQYSLTGQGIDPKDRVNVLKLLYLAESSSAPISEARRTALLEQALREDASDPSLYYQLGSQYEKTGQYDKAMKLYHSALAEGIENGRLHSRMADLYLRQGNKAAAIPEYEKAAQFNPTDLESQTNLATAYLEAGRVDDAERVFRWIVASDPSSAAANNGLGLVAISRHDFPAARTSFERAAALDPDLAEAHMNLGLIYEMQGDRPRARAAFKAFLAKASNTQYAALIPKVKQELAGLQ